MNGKILMFLVLLLISGCGKVYQINPIVNYELDNTGIYRSIPIYCSLTLGLYCSEDNYNEYINPYRFNTLNKSNSLYETASASRLSISIPQNKLCEVFKNISGASKSSKPVFKEIYNKYSSNYNKYHTKTCESITDKKVISENLSSVVKNELMYSQFNFEDISKISVDASIKQIAISMMNLEPSYKINYLIFKNLFGNSIRFDLVGDLEEARIARNLLQTAIMSVSDRALGKHLSAVKATQVNVNMLLGLTTTGLTSGGAIAAEATSKALSAAATGTNSARSLISDQVYRDALAETLINSIITKRLELKREIEIKQLKSISEYHVEAAIADVLDYHEKGSFYYGLTLIREAAEQANLTRLVAVEKDRKNQLDTFAIRSEIELEKQRSILNELRGKNKN